MAKYTATIQLHDAEKKDYESLNIELEKESFKEGKIPSGKIKGQFTLKEYSREGNISLQEVTRSVLKAASKTLKKYSFTVVRNKHFYN
ncbi:MAG: hypothetical protein ABUT20_37555 [Bacteroidota bacterium]